MSPVDFAGLALCGMAAAGVALRGALLSRRVGTPFRASVLTRVLIEAVAVGFVWRAIEIAHGSRVTTGELVLVAAVACAAWSVAVEMLRHGWTEAVEHNAAEAALKARAQDVSVVGDAVKDAVDRSTIEAAAAMLAGGVAVRPDPITIETAMVMERGRTGRSETERSDR